MAVTAMINPYPPPMSTTHPFVGLEASGEYAVTRYPDPYTWATGTGPVVAFDGTNAMVLLDDGRIVRITRVKMADPEAARVTLLAPRK